jgi:hypothetical protein
MMNTMHPDDENRLRNKYTLLLHRLDPDQARLVLGADANAFTAAGEDGISLVARAAGIDHRIVAAGADELDRLNTPTK